MNEGILKVMADLKIDTSITREVSPTDSQAWEVQIKCNTIHFRL